MFKEFYGLQMDAFSMSPDLGFLFISNAHEEAIAHFAYGLEQHEDLILVVGDIGTGKTIALHRLLDQLSNNFVPVFINVTSLDFPEILHLVLMKLEEETGSDSSLPVLIHRFEQILINKRKQAKTVLLVVDEAQNLAPEALESLRMLMNLAQPGGQALQIVLAGQLGLAETLDRPEMRQLRQRIRVEYNFGHLNRQELEDYINHRLTTAGRTKPLFKKSAFDVIFKITKGIPRLVNVVANQALLSGFVDSAKMISGKHVEELSAALAPGERALNVSGPETEKKSDEPPVSTPSGKIEEHSGKEFLEDLIHDIEPYIPETSFSVRRRFWVAAILIVALLTTGYLTKGLWAPLMEFGPLPSSQIVSWGSFTKGLQDENAVSDDNVKPLINDDGPSYVVHIASFYERLQADRLNEQLISDGVISYIRTQTSNQGRVSYSIYLGPFDKRENARDFANYLIEAGLIKFYKISQAGLSSEDSIP
ncbi:MAG: AAA family ATPase [Gemmatimonadales bacterium]|nr:AAA family ATPase [Gemmatimonadales bacterium]